MQKPLYEVMSKALGEFTAPRSVVITIFRNLGAPYDKINTEIPRVYAEDIGISSLEYDARRNESVCMATNIWNYLKHLENTDKLKVPLAKRGIYCFDDLIQNKYHVQLFVGSVSGRRTGNVHIGRDENPSFEGAVKVREK